MKNNIYPILLAGVFVVTLVGLQDPFMYIMPSTAQMLLLLGAVIVAGIWGAFVMQERAHDEREAMLRMRAGRIAYLSGIAVLTVALAIQGLQHAIDPWITAALGVMVVVKIVIRARE